MKHTPDFTAASSQAIIEILCRQLEDIRLSRNISQADLAREAGVSRSTLRRIAEGKAISLDSFVRVIKALRLTDHLAALLPDFSIRPVDRARLGGTERKRAGRKRVSASAAPPATAAVFPLSTDGTRERTPRAR